MEIAGERNKVIYKKYRLYSAKHCADGILMSYTAITKTYNSSTLSQKCRIAQIGEPIDLHKPNPSHPFIKVFARLFSKSRVPRSPLSGDFLGDHISRRVAGGYAVDDVFARLFDDGIVLKPVFLVRIVVRERALLVG